MKYVVAIGSAFDGMDLHGTFDSHEAAIKHAEAKHKGEQWSIVPVFPVETA